MVVVELYNHLDDDHDQNDFLLKNKEMSNSSFHNRKSYFYNMIVEVVVHYDNIVAVVHLAVVV
jgi:hypothetical protein